MQKAFHEDDQQCSEGSLYRDPIRKDSFSQQLCPDPLILHELETTTRSSVGPKGSQHTSMRHLGNRNYQTSRLQHLSLVTSSSPCDTSTNGNRKACMNHLPKQVFPWMKETRHSAKQKSNLPFSVSSSPSSFSSAKRARTAYTQMQLVELEKEFHFNRYLCRPRRLEMAQLLRLSERQIKIWFQNRRMKHKKDSKTKEALRQWPSKSPQMGNHGRQLEAEHEVAPLSSCSKSMEELYNSATSTDPPFNSPLSLVSLDYGLFSVPDGPLVLQGNPSAMGENYLGNMPEADSLLSYPDYSSANLDYRCVAELPSQHQLGLSNCHPIYTDLTTHPVPQGDSQGPVNLMHL